MSYSDNYDFIDFGCSKGDSILYAQKLFGKALKGLGIDTDQKKIDIARERGLDVLNLDIDEFYLEKNTVDFVTMFHFLEHVSDMKDVEEYIRIGCQLSRKFVLIRQPYFDADAYLFQKGLKLFWSDWSGHPNRMTSLEMYNILRTLKETGAIENFSIHVRGRIKDSKDDKVISIKEPLNSFEFSKSKNKIVRPNVVFDKMEVWSELVAVLTMNGTSGNDIVKKVAVDKTLFKGV